MARSKIIISLLIAAGIVSAFFSCTRVDDRLGAGLEPDSEQMQIGTARYALFPNSTLMRARLHQQDSVRSSNLGRGYFGATTDPVFGTRRAGFISQFHTAALSDVENGFGADAVFDSMQLKLFIKEHVGDTLQPMHYNIHEIPAAVMNDLLAAHPDTLFYPTFDPSTLLSSLPAFTFTFPDGSTTGPYTEYITLHPTDTGRELIDRLMSDDAGSRGCLYISLADGGEGNMFATDLLGTGVMLYAHRNDPEDPTLVRDTLTASYAFLTDEETDEEGETVKKRTDASINVVQRDYAPGSIDMNLVASPPTQLYIDGMSGVVPQLTFTEELFAELATLLDTDPANEGSPYTSLAFNRAQLIVYLDDTDWTQLDPVSVTSLLDGSMLRLGLYTDYHKMIAVADYDYLYEKVINTDLPFGGHLNRSRACYLLDISRHLQSLWNDYRDGKPIDGTVYLGPEAFNAYGLKRTVAKSVELDVVYTLIK